MHDVRCFHCNLPVTSKSPPTLTVDNQQQAFCCHGCHAVTDFIVKSGNVEYYQHRDVNARTFNAEALPRLLEKLKLYDKEEIQREFVRTGKDNDWKEAWLVLDEIRCAACIWLNERTLRSIEGVLDVQMDYTSQQARVRWQPEAIQLSDILAAITRIGYYAHPFDPSQREALNQEQKQRSVQRILFALVLGMAVMQSSIGGYFYGQSDSEGNYPLWFIISRWVNVVSTFLILAYPGQIFFKNAWRDLKNKSLGMDVPVVIGLSLAWCGSLYHTIRGHSEDVYFESIAMFVIFLLVARYIELQSRITATALLDRSAKIIPQTASLLLDGVAQEVAVVDLNKGDRLQVAPGEALAVDAILCSSASSFDESLLTGESLPVHYMRGDKVLGGSINVEQVIEVEVVSSKHDSTLNEIHQLTKKSVSYRPPYIDLAEKVAGKFVAVILFIALATYSFWYWVEPSSAMSNMISVLIVTCPCALALAAPVALSLGAAGLSRLHVLPVRMSSIEKISHVGSIIFDKTGTLTTGAPILDKMVSLGELTESDYLNIAVSMEQGSQHPFAKALSQALEPASNKISAELKSVKQYPGQGVEAEIEEANGHVLWRLGNEPFTQSNTYLLPESLALEVAAMREQGGSILYLSKAQTLQAVFFIVDPLREGIDTFLTHLQHLGITKYIILSGDHPDSVRAIARKLNIKQAFGGLLPHEKLAWLKTYQQAEKSRTDVKPQVIMMGDGINDAPTLAAADVSFTFSDATDLAKNNSDFLLLGKGFEQLGFAFKLMAKTRKIILQNLGWAILYNSVAVPAAVAGIVTPWMAAIGMSLSSLLVVLNSLRLKKLL